MPSADALSSAPLAHDLAPYRALCDGFLNRVGGHGPSQCPVAPRGWCFIASLLFGAHCFAHGHAPVLWRLELDLDVLPIAGRPSELTSKSGVVLVHCVVALDDHVIVDWTARRFNLAFPCPVLVPGRGGAPPYLDGAVLEADVAWKDWAALPPLGPPSGVLPLH